MSTNCKFHLSKLYETYECGELIEGYIVLNLPNPEPIEDIQISLRGNGCVSWKDNYATTNQDGHSTFKENVHFSSLEMYVDFSEELMGECELDAGVHNMPFSLRVPEECPASFKGTWGSISYHLAVTVFAKKVKKFKHDITVASREDLNQHPEYKIPVQAEETKTFCWMACTDGRILYSLTTPYGAYVPLQKMHYIIRVENQSMNDVCGYEIEIIQKTTYTAKTPELRTLDEIDSVFNREFSDTCLRLTTRIFENSIQIPPVSPSIGGNNADSIISIEYLIKLTIFVSGCALNSELTMPLHLGTIPLDETLLTGDEVETVDTRPRTPPRAPSPSTARDRPPGYHYFKPPSFSDVNRYNQVASFDSAITASAPAYDSIANERNRPFIGLAKPT